MYKPPFDITSEMLRLISEISEQVGIINMRLGENAPSPHLRKKSQIKTIHSSLAIEHNSLSLMLKAHALMMKDLVKQAGHYRNDGVGVFDGNGNCLHMAPPADRVPQLMGDLFHWVKTTKEHPLIHSCVFHYEFEFIHPFIDGNGRMGRFWQTMLLSRWKGIFAWLPCHR